MELHLILAAVIIAALWNRRAIKQSQKETIMALTAAEQKIIDQFNEATTKVSDRLDQLIANPPDTTAEFIAALQPIADHLDVMGTNPANPTPALPPAATPPTA